MQTTIGRRTNQRRNAAWAAAAFAIVVVATDLLIVGVLRFPDATQPRWALVVVAALVQIRIGGDLASAGLVVRPTQGWRWWIGVTVWLGVAVACCIAVGVGLLLLAGRDLPVVRSAPSAFPSMCAHMCVYAPLSEEVIYRLVLCSSLVPLLGPRLTIVASGVLFGLLHVVYGNPSPENLLGGFVLGWAFLRSDSFCVPVLLHSLGNLCALLSQIAAWYVIPQ